MDAIIKFCEVTKDFFSGIGKLFYYITHPLELLALIWQGIVYISFFACMGVCLACVILFLCGAEKFKRYAIVSVMVYVAITMIDAGVR